MITRKLSLSELLTEYFIKGGCFHFSSIYELHETHAMIYDRRQDQRKKLADRRKRIWRNIRSERKHRSWLRQRQQLTSSNLNKLIVARDWSLEIRASHEKTRMLNRERNKLKTALKLEVAPAKLSVTSLFTG